jgi:hypothetical protein
MAEVPVGKLFCVFSAIVEEPLKAPSSKLFLIGPASIYELVRTHETFSHDQTELSSLPTSAFGAHLQPKYNQKPK